jgi:hypothetical protein
MEVPAPPIFAAAAWIRMRMEKEGLWRNSSYNLYKQLGLDRLAMSCDDVGK